MSYWMRVKALFQTKQLDRDLEDELAFHLAMREEKNRERGIEGEEARYAARRHFGKFTRNVHGEPGMFSYSEYKNYRASNHFFSGMLAYAPFLEATLGGESPSQVMGAETSCNFFDVLRERPALGRTFVEADCSAPGP